MAPDPWQTALLSSPAERLLLLTSRQAGKSTTAAALAVTTACLHKAALVLLLSPSERQSEELAALAFAMYDALGQPVRFLKRTGSQLHLTNGSRLVALPESPRTIRGYSGAALLVIDEAAQVSDDLYHTVRPMLAVSKGRLLALSTPFGQRGWFYTAWQEGQDWRRERVTAEQCPRIGADFLAAERQALGERWFLQEYCCSFESDVGAVFAPELVSRAFQAGTGIWG
jgi:Terminase large subunit, T4likevirus-type, N-terminal